MNEQLIRYTTMMSELITRSYDRVLDIVADECKNNEATPELIEELYRQMFNYFQVHSQIIAVIRKLDTENELEEKIAKMEECNNLVAKTLNDLVQEPL